MKITLYQIDAFASRVFAGNPAAVCPLEKWLEDDLMQAIAMENNLSETAFFVLWIRDITFAGLHRHRKWICAATQRLLRLMFFSPISIPP